MRTDRPPAQPEGMAFLIWAATPERPDLCVTPLIHALAASALDCTVEIHFAGPAVRWLVEGVAAERYPTPERVKSILDFLREAVAAGARLQACSMAREAWIGTEERLIDECHGMAGATAFVARALDPAWRTMVF